MERIRADLAMVSRGLAGSREKARRLIEAGLVTLNGSPLGKPAKMVDASDALSVLGEDHPYVSRGGLKLEKALQVFDVDPQGLICADIGASTGGFTDVLLRNGAALVFAVDVGRGQLHPSLLNDPRVINMEHVNARCLEAGMFPAPIALAVMDVSFISVRLILPSLLRVLGSGGQLVTLIKPQFEAGRQNIGKGGIVSDPKAHSAVLREIAAFVPALGWRVQALDYSPVAGGDGNIEYLAHLLPAGKGGRDVSAEDIDGVIRQARVLREKR